MTDAINNIGQNAGLGGGLQSADENSSVSKDEFLKLLTYQLKYQNPLNPYDNQEFAAQLAQFSQLEQLTEIKSLLETQMQMNQMLTQTVSNTALPGLLGKSAKAISDNFAFDGENPVKISYSNPFNAKSGEILIKDSSGNTVRRIPISGDLLKSGDHDLAWDGKAQDGSSLPEGQYFIETNFKDASGSEYSADTYLSGKIDSVRFKAEGTIIVIDGTEVPLQNVSDIMT